ncbi:MAG TPA: ferritin-like domain-containing protein [Chloroflexota bacterium]
MAAGAASFVLAACGGGAQQPSAAPAASSAPPATKPSAAASAASAAAAKPSAAASALSSAAASSQASPSAKQADIAILNSAIDIEHQAIWTYNAAGGTKLLQKPVLDVALLFKSQHEQHRDALSDAVVKLGGTPVKTKDKYELPDLKTQNDILTFALKLEDTAAKAYVDAVAKLNDRALAQSAASVGIVEGEHAAILREALGQPPIPAAFA